MASTDENESATMSVWPEAATLLGIKCKDTAYRAAAAGEIPAFRIGRLWRVSRLALQRKLENPMPPKAA